MYKNCFTAQREEFILNEVLDDFPIKPFVTHTTDRDKGNGKQGGFKSSTDNVNDLMCTPPQSSGHKIPVEVVPQ